MCVARASYKLQHNMIHFVIWWEASHEICRQRLYSPSTSNDDARSIFSLCSILQFCFSNNFFFVASFYFFLILLFLLLYVWIVCYVWNIRGKKKQHFHFAYFHCVGYKIHFIFIAGSFWYTRCAVRCTDARQYTRILLRSAEQST